MKPSILLLLLAALVFGASACTRLNTPEKKAGYAVGEKFGTNLDQIKDKVDMDQLVQGLTDQLAGTATMSDDDVRQALSHLQPGGQLDDKGKEGYAVGVTIAKNVKPVLAYIDPAMIARGIKDQLKGKPKLGQDELAQVLADLTKRVESVASAKNKADGDAFLAKNKALPDVKVTASGLQYQVERPGHGRKPGADDTVVVNYVGTLPDGTKFDSSYDRHQPATFQANRVIPGWTEGLQLMSVGSKFRFVIPSALGYGEHGAGGQIGPDQVLVFEVELLSVKKTAPAPNAPLAPKGGASGGIPIN